MDKVAIYVNETSNLELNEKIAALLKRKCEQNGYTVAFVLGENTHGEGISMPMKYAFIGMFVAEEADVVVTFNKHMLGVSDEEIKDILRLYGDFDVEVKTFTNDLNELYDEIYGLSDSQEIGADSQEQIYLEHLLEALNSEIVIGDN